MKTTPLIPQEQTMGTATFVSQPGDDLDEVTWKQLGLICVELGGYVVLVGAPLAAVVRISRPLRHNPTARMMAVIAAQAGLMGLTRPIRDRFGDRLGSMINEAGPLILP